MELKDCIYFTNSNDYKERFMGEYFELAIRYQKLNDYIEKIKTEDAKHDCPIELLSKQALIMRDYMALLMERATIEHIDLFKFGKPSE